MARRSWRTVHGCEYLYVRAGRCGGRGKVHETEGTCETADTCPKEPSTSLVSATSRRATHIVESPMSTVVSHNTAILAGCRAAASSRPRAVSAVRAPRAVAFGTGSKARIGNRGNARAVVLRASEDEAPAAESAAAAEDSEEVKGAKLTAIVTGA